MDNDISLVKYLKKRYKTIKFNIDYRGYTVLKASVGNAVIKQIVDERKPAMMRCYRNAMYRRIHCDRNIFR